MSSPITLNSLIREKSTGRMTWVIAVTPTGIVVSGRDFSTVAMTDAYAKEHFEVATDRAVAYSTEGKPSEVEINSLAFEVADLVGDDGSGDIGVITRQAVKDSPRVTAQEIAEIVRQAREDAAGGE